MNTLSSSEKLRAMMLSWRLQHFAKISSDLGLDCLYTLGEDRSNQLLSKSTVSRIISTFYLQLQKRW